MQHTINTITTTTTSPPTSKLSDRQLINAIGVSAISQMCVACPTEVDKWRRNGIPKQHLLLLRVVRPDLLSKTLQRRTAVAFDAYLSLQYGEHAAGSVPPFAAFHLEYMAGAVEDYGLDLLDEGHQAPALSALLVAQKLQDCLADLRNRATAPATAEAVH